MHKIFKTRTNTNTSQKTTKHTYHYAQTKITKQEGDLQTNIKQQNHSKHQQKTSKHTTTNTQTNNKKTKHTTNMLNVFQTKTNNNTREEAHTHKKKRLKN